MLVTNRNNSEVQVHAVSVDRRRFLAVAILLLVGAHAGLAQSTVSVSVAGSAEGTIEPRAVALTFIRGDSGDPQEVVRNAVIAHAEDRAVGALAQAALPIPLIGTLATQTVSNLIRRFRKQTVKVSTVAYLPGVSAGTTLARGELAFTIPAQALLTPSGQPSVPILMRLETSNDTARIVRVAHVALKQTNDVFNPVTATVLRTEQETVPCHIETRSGGDVVLTLNSLLQPGEYAIVVAPNGPCAGLEGTGMVAWDFKVSE
jgi:hypothetical protein